MHEPRADLQPTDGVDDYPVGTGMAAGRRDRVNFFFDGLQSSGKGRGLRLIALPPDGIVAHDVLQPGVA